MRKYLLLAGGFLLLLGLLLLPTTLTQTSNGFSVDIISEKHDLTEHEAIFRIQNLDNSSRDFNLTVLINNTDFDPSKIKDLTIYEYKPVPKEFPVYVEENVTVNYTVDLTNTTNFTLPSNCWWVDNSTSDNATYSCNETVAVQNGTVTKNVLDWSPIDTYTFVYPDKVLSNHVNVTIPSYGSECLLDDLNNSYDCNGTKLLKVTWETPIGLNGGGWGSKGYYAIIDANTGISYDPWWNIAWQYRRSITINNTANANALTNYQVAINLTYNSHMQSDFSDIRFTYVNSSGEYEIPYWIEQQSNSNWAYVWVKVPSIPANGYATVYVYYGNTTPVSSASSYSNTFESWHYEDRQSTTMCGLGADSTTDYVFRIIPIPSGYRLKIITQVGAWMYQNSANGDVAIAVIYGDSNMPDIGSSSTSLSAHSKTYVGRTSPITPTTTTQLYVIDVFWIVDNNYKGYSNLWWAIDGYTVRSEGATGSSCIGWTGNFNDGGWFNNAEYYPTVTKSCCVDWSRYITAYIRKYTSPDPTYSIGSEETGPTKITSCTTISSPGEYVLANDIIDSSASTCMNIQANNVILDCQGHTIDGVDASGSYGIYIYRSSATTTNITIKNCVVTDWYEGIYLWSSSYNTISNNIANSNTNDGICLGSSSNNNIVSNNTANGNTFGISLGSSSYNTISNNILSGNTNDGINFYLSSYNTISNNILSGNTNGIYLWSSSNNIYNNLFNNTNNFRLGGTNYWNTTLQSGPNIVGGPYIGGNYWGFPNGTGYSETCVDANYDGICDSPYTLDNNNIDYLPLAKAVGQNAPYLQVTPNYNIVDFGTIYPPVTDNPAPNQANGVYSYTISTNANYKVSVYGSDFSSSFSISNLKFQATDDVSKLSSSSAIALSTTSQTAGTFSSSVSTLYHGYWLTVPKNTPAGSYSTTVYIDISLA